MFWSLTPFANELDILAIRLAELDPIVDRHVIVEATRTQSGQPKPLLYAENQARFERWGHKIRHVVVDDMPTGPDNWAREAFQRDAALRGCDGLEPGDVVLVSDVDEIPSADVLATLEPGETPLRLRMSMHLYRLNWRWRENPVNGGTRALLCRGAILAHQRPSELVRHDQPWEAHIPWAGWHMSYQGDADFIVAKIANLADAWIKAESVTPQVAELSIRTGRDLFGRHDRNCEWVPVSELPAVVRDNEEGFRHMLVDQP